MKQNICILGLGYIGLPTAALLANQGYKVLGIDVSEDVVNTVNNGEIHIVEPELDAYVAKAVKNKMLTAALEPQEADVFVIAVPTPFHEGHVPNIDYVESATRAIAPV
uniref:NAD-binding protein n=1 Tax=Idiomarina sp. TaxID=1874361 RepID=UPI0025836330